MTTETKVAEDQYKINEWNQLEGFEYIFTADYDGKTDAWGTVYGDITLGLSPYTNGMMAAQIKLFCGSSNHIDGMIEVLQKFSQKLKTFEAAVEAMSTAKK